MAAHVSHETIDIPRAAGPDNNGLTLGDSIYNRLLQAYFAWSRSLQNYAGCAGLEPKEAGRAKFLLS